MKRSLCLLCVWKFFLFSPIKFLSFHPNFSTSHFSSVFLFPLCCSLLKSCSHQKRPYKPLKNNNSTETAAETEQSLASSEREREEKRSHRSRSNKKKHHQKSESETNDEQRTNRTRRSKPLLSNAIDSRTLGTNVTLLS